MKRTATLIVLAMAFSALPSFGQNQKEMIQALQRDLASLQDEVKKMQAAQISQNEKLATITEKLANTLDVVQRINEKMAVTQTTMTQQLSEVTRQVGTPVQSLSTKVDGMNDQFLNLSNTIAELNSRMGKFDSKLEDVKKMIQTMPAQTSPPPSQQGGNPGVASAVSGEKLFEDANRDYLGGNSDLALRGFADYLKSFPDTQQAADAQFYIGEIYSRKAATATAPEEDYNNAIRAYEAVIANYSDSSRVPNAHYMKGVACVKLGRRADAAKEFKIVADKSPSTELGKKAKDYLKVLGVPVSQAPAQKKSTKRRN